MRQYLKTSYFQVKLQLVSNMFIEKCLDLIIFTSCDAECFQTATVRNGLLHTSAYCITRSLDTWDPDFMGSSTRLDVIRMIDWTAPRQPDGRNYWEIRTLVSLVGFNVIDFVLELCRERDVSAFVCEGKHTSSCPVFISKKYRRLLINEYTSEWSICVSND